jgi:hypothetical protein
MMLKKFFSAAKDFWADGLSLEIADTTPLNTSQQWIVALGALLNAKEGHRLNTMDTGTNSDSLREGLSQAWGVDDREEFLQTAQRLASFRASREYELIWEQMRKVGGIDTAAGQAGVMAGLLGGVSKYLDVSNYALVGPAVKALAGRTREDDKALGLMLTKCGEWMADLEGMGIQAAQVTNLMAWDTSRLINLGRWACQLGWITQEEYFDMCTPVAKQAQDSYGSWQDFTSAAFVASMIWRYDESRHTDFAGSFERLMNQPKSPLRKLSWNVVL